MSNYPYYPRRTITLSDGSYEISTTTVALSDGHHESSSHREMPHARKKVQLKPLDVPHRGANATVQIVPRWWHRWVSQRSTP